MSERLQIIPIECYYNDEPVIVQSVEDIELLYLSFYDLFKNGLVPRNTMPYIPLSDDWYGNY